MRYSAWNRRANGRGFRLPPWRIALLLALAAALGVAIAIVATGVFLVALPIAALTIAAYRLFGRRRRPHHPDVIEGEYEVVERARPGQRR